MNKRGFIMGFWIVILTITLMGISVWMYQQGQLTIRDSVTPPAWLLSSKDQLVLFELSEEQAMKESFKEVRDSGVAFADASFADTFVASFFPKMVALLQASPLLMPRDSFLLDGVPVRFNEASFDWDGFVSKRLYRVVTQGDVLLIQRYPLTKVSYPAAPKTTISFPVHIEFTFHKGYTFNAQGGLI